MNKTTILVILTTLLLCACTAQPSPTPPPPSATLSPTATAPPPAPVSRPLPNERGELFAASGLCAACHTNLVDASKADVSLDTFWRGTMMANAARDPYWRASFKAEVLNHPHYQEIIEDKCTTCHTPMARFTASAGGGVGRAFEAGFFDPTNTLHTLAVDGVSCTLCHQIDAAGLGGSDSHSGGFMIDTTLPAGERLSFGPYPVEAAQISIMQGASGYVPEQGGHVQKSELCATCHTLYTPYLDASGQIAGEFPEQTPYLEWLHSDYRQTHSCQDCHMPPAQGEVLISITGGVPRSPFSQHTFVGGNAYVLGLLSQFGDELETTAASEHFDQTIARVTDQLQNRTATIALEAVHVADGHLTADIVVASQVGHKFPSAYPARRVWLHFTVRDADGQVLFESGAPNPDGSIAHNDNDADPARFEPHYLTIEGADQVQIYEAIMADSDGQVTTTLLRGAGYLKDNRLLPLGFASIDDIAVRGRAAEDADFEGGSDRVQYNIPLDDAQGPFTVTVELLYQSISYRWAENLRQHQAPEIERFLRYQEAAPLESLVVTSATVKINE